MEFIKEYSAFDDLDLYDRNDLSVVEEMQLALYFIKWVINDEQFDPSSENHLGFINLSEDGFSDPKMKQGFLMFLKYKNEFDLILRKLGFAVDAPWSEDETVINKLNT